MPEYEVAVLDDGFETLAGTWFDSLGGNLAAGSAVITGVSVVVPQTFATDRADIALNPPTFSSLKLILTTATLFPAGTFSLWVVNDPIPTKFTDVTYMPSQLLANAYLSSDAVAVPLIPIDTEYEVTIDLDSLYPVYRQSNWNGRLNFFFQHTGQAIGINFYSGDSAFPPRIETVELPFLTGVEKYVDARSRVDRCPRCGEITIREKLIQDGFISGNYLVCKECWDPEDVVARPIPPDLPPIND